jgi:ATP-dependent Clp protease ATP-binding subunit ClpC
MAGTGRMDRYTQATRDAIAHAKKSVTRYRHSHITPEHIFFGLMELNDPLVLKGLSNKRASAKELRMLVEKHLRNGEYDIPDDELTFSERAKRVIEAAREECVRAQAKQIAPEHILLGMTRVPNTVCGAVLSAVDLSTDIVRANLS